MILCNGNANTNAIFISWINGTCKKVVQCFSPLLFISSLGHTLTHPSFTIFHVLVHFKRVYENFSSDLVAWWAEVEGLNYPRSSEVISQTHPLHWRLLEIIAVCLWVSFSCCRVSSAQCPFRQLSALQTITYLLCPPSIFTLINLRTNVKTVLNFQ